MLVQPAVLVAAHLHMRCLLHESVFVRLIPKAKGLDWKVEKGIHVIASKSRLPTGRAELPSQTALQAWCATSIFRRHSRARHAFRQAIRPASVRCSPHIAVPRPMACSSSSRAHRYLTCCQVLSSSVAMFITNVFTWSSRRPSSWRPLQHIRRPYALCSRCPWRGCPDPAAR